MKAAVASSKIRAVLAGMADERFAWLVRHEPEPVAAELDRRTELAALEAELRAELLQGERKRRAEAQEGVAA